MWLLEVVRWLTSRKKPAMNRSCMICKGICLWKGMYEIEWQGVFPLYISQCSSIQLVYLLMPSWLYTNHLRRFVDSIFRNISCAGLLRVLNSDLPSYNHLCKELDATVSSHSADRIPREDIVSTMSCVQDVPCLHSCCLKCDQREDHVGQRPGFRRRTM